jgi:multiple antibiotic resistance protein
MSPWETFLLVFCPSVFAIVNPLGVVGPFMALTRDQNEVGRKRVAMNACWTSLGILVSCVFLGTLIFKVMGISMGAVRIGGGFLLLVVGMEMVRQKAQGSALEDADEVSVFPLAIPLLAGPGSIVTVLVLVQKYPQLISHVLLSVAILVNFFLSYLILRHSSRLLGWIGPSTMRAFSKLMGLLVTCLAIQFVMDGVLESFPILKG